MKAGVRVEGVPEAQEAFASVREDVTPGAVAGAAAEAVIPYVSRLSRRDTGAMAQGWDVQTEDTEAYFINSQDYWTYQEFGTESIDPMHAIPQAWERAENDAIEAAGKVVIDVGKDNGFEQ